MYNTAYELIIYYQKNKANPEEDEATNTVLFSYFKKKTEQGGLTNTNTECMLRFANNKDCLNQLLKFYEESPVGFSIGRTYTLIEMLLGFNYGQMVDEIWYNKLVNRVKEEDQTNTLENQLQKFEVMKLNPQQRKEALKKYMENKGQAISVAEMENFASAFNSRFLPLDVKRQNYEQFFDDFMSSVRANNNMYVRVSCWNNDRKC